MKKLIVFMLTLCLLFGGLSVCAYATNIGDIPATDPNATAEPSSTEFSDTDPYDTSIGKVYLQLKYDKPVIFNKVDACVLSCSTEGCTVNSIAWYDPNGNVVTGDTFTLHGSYRLEVVISTLEGYAFTNSTAVYINNSRSACSIGPNIIKVSATMQSVYWAPVINTQPDTRKHNVTEGDCLTLTASASYYDKCTWKVMTSGGKIYSLIKSADKFEGLTVIGADTPTLQLNNIPLSMSGCRVFCTFSNDAASADTQGVPLTVNKDPNKVQPTPTPTPTPEPSEAPQTGPETEPGEETPESSPDVPTDTAHVHSFLDSWSSDDESHWHECACGAISDPEPHSFKWTTLKRATGKEAGEEEGVCSVCGRTVTRPIEKKASSGGKLGLIVPVVLIIVIAAVGVMMYATRQAKARYSGSKHSKH